MLRIQDKHPGSTSKNLSILTQKNVSKLSEIWSGLFIPDPDPVFLPIPDPAPQHCTVWWIQDCIHKYRRVYPTIRKRLDLFHLVLRHLVSPGELLLQVPRLVHHRQVHHFLTLRHLYIEEIIIFCEHKGKDPFRFLCVFTFRPPGSGSISQRYDSGSCSRPFYHQAKIVSKSLYLLFVTSFWVFICEKWFKCTFKKK